MSLSERRREVRLQLQIPLQFRPLLQPLAPVQRTRTLNISPKGVYFATEYPFQVGSVAELTFNSPKELTGHESTPVRCTARVMHVTPLQNGAMSGVGMQIDRMEPLLNQTLSPVRGARPGSAGAI